MLLEAETIKDRCIIQTRKEWLDSDDSFPDFLNIVTREAQIRNEQYIKSVSENLQQQFKNFPIHLIGRKKWKKQTLGMIKDALYNETIIGIHHYMDNRSIDMLLEEIKEFLRHARRFAPELSIEGIGQAVRNYIVYAMFNEINQVKSGFNMACFGYSMLYPFTDNYIDNQNHSDEEKKDYNRIIRCKIEGREVNPESLHQLKTCKLLQAIESEYPRDADPAVFNLLLMMLEAQEQSLRQQNKESVLTAEERLDISLFKGGISVLIDRFFVKKDITEDDSFLYFGFGFFLQLADDLQDIREDSDKGHQTILTMDLHSGSAEKIVNKMFRFIHGLLCGYKAVNEDFKQFILMNCYQLIYISIFKSREFFSEAYLDRLERYFPVMYSFIENFSLLQIKDMDIKDQAKYMKILDGLL